MKGQNYVSQMSGKEKADIAASFQQAIVDVLVKKTQKSADKTKAKTVMLGGGVAANGEVRQAMQLMCDKSDRKLLVAEKRYCTDNAVMIASLAYHKFSRGLFADFTLEAKATG